MIKHGLIENLESHKFACPVRIKRMKVIECSIIAWIILFALVPAMGQVRLHPATLYKNIEMSDFILLGECVSVSKDTIEIEYSYLPGQTFSGPRYGTYRVIKSWKDYPGDEYYTCDFLAINEAYEPDGHFLKAPQNGLLPVVPETGATAYLFVDDNALLSEYKRGFTPEPLDTIEKYGHNEAITKLVALSELDDVERIESMIGSLWKGRGLYVACIKVALLNLPCQYFVEYFEELMQSDNPRVKIYTLWAIERDIDNIDIHFLRKFEPLLQDSSSEMRKSAYRIINGIDADYAERYFLTNFSSLSPDLKVEVIKLNTSEEVPEKAWSCQDIFYDAARDLDLNLRTAGIRALKYCFREEAQELIYEALNDTNSAIQAAGLQAAITHAKPVLINYALGLLKSPAGEVRFEAVDILWGLNFAYRHSKDSTRCKDIPIALKDIALSRDKVGIRLKALDALHKMAATIVLELYPVLLRDSEPQIRTAIAYYMGSIGNNQYLPLLDEALANETDESTMFAIKRAMVQIYTYSALPGYMLKIEKMAKEVQEIESKYHNVGH